MASVLVDVSGCFSRNSTQAGDMAMAMATALKGAGSVTKVSGQADVRLF